MLTKPVVELWSAWAGRGVWARSMGLMLLLASALCGAEPEGRVAIFKDDVPVSGASSSPDHLAAVLKQAGLMADFLTSDQLANFQQFNRDRFDVLVLPYGASFPVHAADNFRKFLHSGGKFLSTGGYAFDHLLERTANGWRALPASGSTPARRRGVVL